MNRHDFGSDINNVPAGAKIEYPRTIDDEATEFAAALQDEHNIAGLARHEPRQDTPARVYDKSEEIKITLKLAVKSDDDDVAELMSDLSPQEQWDAFMTRAERKRAVPVLGRIANRRNR